MKTETKITIISLMFILGIIGLFVYSTIDSRIENPSITVATLKSFTRVGAKSQMRGVYVYEVSGKQYEEVGYYNTSSVIGEKFKVQYDNKNPAEAKVIRHAPVILKNELIDSTIGVIEDVPGLLHNVVKFKYNVGELTYFKAQEVSDEQESKGITVGARYKIKYLKNNPSRCILLLDSPVKN